ncbi:MAG: hypothetical protein RL264_907 [Bacteroidota bacterium]|jgi:hypothetical protein
MTSFLVDCKIDEYHFPPWWMNYSMANLLEEILVSSGKDSLAFF